MQELWRRVKDHPDYEVSNMGRIRKFETKKELHPKDDGRGYLRVDLDRKHCKLHKLVAEAFIPNPDNKPLVNHKKGKKHDCRASQLEWVTHSENTKHAYDTGLIKRKKNEVQGRHNNQREGRDRSATDSGSQLHLLLSE